MGIFSFFKRKEPEPEIIIQELPKECSHKWRDFPWYMEYDYDTNTGSLKVGIYEPYVCIHCKKRENVTLYQEKWQYLKEKQIEGKRKYIFVFDKKLRKEWQKKALPYPKKGE